MGYTFETESKSNQKEIPTNTYLPCGVIKANLRLVKSFFKNLT